MFILVINMSKKTKSILIILSIILFVIGLATYSKFIHWFLVRREGIKYIVSGVSEQFSHMILFSLVFAVIPLSAFVLKLKNVKNIFISSGILLGFVLAAIVGKRSLLIHYIEKFYVPSINGEKLESQFLLRESSPETYMFVALVTGFILLIILKSLKVLFRYDSEESTNKLRSQLLSKQ
jgi:hypothetical protein